MTILVVAGIDPNWCSFAENRLCQMGAQSGSEPLRSGDSPSDFLAKATHYHNGSLEVPLSIEQLEMGKAWHVSAADIILANAEKENWVWAQPEHVFLLDFWKEFDTGTRFVLIYGDAEEYFAGLDSANANDPDELDQKIKIWEQYHTELLKFFHANPDRSILVHVSQFDDNAAMLTRQINDVFDLDLNILNRTEYAEQSAILRLISEKALGNLSYDSDLYNDLECSASLPAKSNGDVASIADAAATEYHRIHLELSAMVEAQDIIESQNERLERMGAELEQLEADLDRRIHSTILRTEFEKEREERIQLKTENDQLVDANSRSKREINALKMRLGDFESEQGSNQTHTNELKIENDLLQKQLYQVQEELERYFKLYQAEVSNAKETPVAEPEIDEFSLDMRHYLNGTGWHNAEEHGRWAGEKLASTIQLPRLRPGAYEVVIELVDAMNLDIVKGTKLQIGDRTFEPTIKWLSKDRGRLAPMRRFMASSSKDAKPFPALLKAQIDVPVSDRGQNGPRLVVSCPEAVSPVQMGEPDERNLTICAKSLVIRKRS